MERSSFFDATLVGETYDRVYLAEDFARYFSSFIGNGVFPSPSTNLQVVQDVNMQVKLKAGKAWINGYFYDLTEDLIINVDVADGVLKRIDKVVIRLDFINREIKAYVKKGTFASSPISPTLTRNADIYELGIADILINNGATSIVQANITDLRQNNTYCGLVAGVVQQIDTTNLFAQFESAFNVWFDAIKGQLSTDAAGNLQNQLDIIKPLVDTWIDFKTNGGTLFNSLELKSLSSLVDTINTSKGYLGLNAGDKGIVIDKVNNAFRASSTSMNEMTVGMMSNKFRNIYLTDYIASVNGYTKLTNGFIEQWGEVAIPLTLAASYTKLITFPIAFPNKCIGVYPVCDYDGTGSSSAAIASILTNAFAQSNQDFILQCGAVQLSGTGWASGSRNFRIKWRSIGY